MYTDETVLTYGKYKGKMLKEIPDEYFINVCTTGGEEQAELKKYIEANINRFVAVSLFALKKSPPIDFICLKRTYATKKAAMDSIVKPTSKSHKPVPIRAYECPECSGWHLSSKPDRGYQNKTTNKQ
jgi:hypothetical protein